MKKNAVKFLIVGVGAFTIDYGLTLLLHYKFNVIGYAASAIGFAIGFVFSFTLSRHWVFRPKASYKFSMKRQIIFYLILAVINLIISTAIVAGFSIINVDVVISKAIAIALIACWNFIMNHFLIFIEDKEVEETNHHAQ